MVSNKFMEFRGLSTDTKPDETKDNVGNGAAFIEIDTGKLYFYDAENSQWVEFAPSGSSSGGDTLASAAEGNEG